ncbi:hypothetical protein CEQ21_21925 [Niallia circulans]|uniref:DUF4259 domain-containing protein n=1 Tax=Niallia circulans TaxID=1397 RepID=A0A553SM58_NIACI|nr:hypothetical protein [Niallia circulans]TRZ38074.1 hypothetical protein CEQ21_21925 [Niallia circulans]
MGVWGTAILSNDLADDIKFRYRDLLGDNYSDVIASKIVIEEFLKELDDEEITAFWLSFALIQWKLGRLQADVKAIALQIIDSGADLQHWEEDTKIRKQRVAVLNKFREQLNSPQPQTKKVPKRFIIDTTLKARDAISYQLLSGEYIIFKVIGIIEQWTGDRYPLLELCDWKGIEIPSRDEINTLKLLKEPSIDGDEMFRKIAILPKGKRDDPTKRIRLVAEDVRIASNMEPPYVVAVWKEVDKYLQNNYNLE